MFSTFKSRARVAGTGIALASVAVLPTQVLAQAATAESAKPAQSQEAQAISDVNSQIVVRDAASGTLRSATTDEVRTMREQHALGRLRAAPQASLVRFHANGARGARLTDEFMSYSVIVRQPDGSLKEFCFESREAAEAAVKAPASVSMSKPALPTE